MIVEIKLKRDNGDLIFEGTGNALSYFVARFPDPIIEAGFARKLWEFRYFPIVGGIGDMKPPMVEEVEEEHEEPL